jgi:hypothetical protein
LPIGVRKFNTENFVMHFYFLKFFYSFLQTPIKNQNI